MVSKNFDQSFQIGIALHACGNATDYAQLKAMQQNATYLLSPCCVGKLKHSVDEIEKEEQKMELKHPRSNWMSNCISVEEFCLLAKAADWSAYDFELKQVFMKSI